MNESGVISFHFQKQCFSNVKFENIIATFEFFMSRKEK